MANGKLFCAFCGICGTDEVLGPIVIQGDLIVHEHCLYFSSGLAQNGTDGESNTINGFLVEDVNKELRRGLKIKCSGCKQPGGYIGCAVRTCRKAGHFPCLHTLGYTFQHCGSFEAFCPKHCPTQSKIQNTDESNECCICLTELGSSNKLYCPCCLTTFHKICIQKQAWSAGSHYLRCAVCKDKDIYCSEMLRMGIAIPDRDAQWEIDLNDASEDVKLCRADHCLCPEGRSYSTQIGKYRMRKCTTCGQCRGHVECLRREEIYECQDCRIVEHASSQLANSKLLSTSTTQETMASSTATRGSDILLHRSKVLVLSLKKLNYSHIK